MAKRSKKATKPACSRCKDSGLVDKVTLLEQFNPHSSDQVMALMRQLKLKIPTKRGEARETTEAKYLKRLSKKYPVFKDIIDCREKQKATSTYVYPTNSNGRVTTTYGFWPSTGRKASRNVNLQNIPIRNAAMAEAIRGTMVAASGHVLLEADYESIEAVIVGVCAGDPAYINMAKAGVHGFLASHILHQPIDPKLPFDQLRTACKGIKKADFQTYDKAKRIVHGTAYGLTPYGIYDEYEEEFKSRKEAAELQELYLSLFPSIRRWQGQTLELASRQTYLDNHYKFRHYFFNVFSWNRNTDSWGLGEDAKRAIAFVPQSDASAIQNIDLLSLTEDSLIEPTLRLVVHDSLVCEVPLELLEYVCHKLQVTMSRSRPELNGTNIGVEISYGTDLRKSNMNTWKPKEEACLASTPVLKPESEGAFAGDKIDLENTVATPVSITPMGIVKSIIPPSSTL